MAAGCRSPTACGRSPLASEGALGIVRFFMLFSVFYFSLFLSVGLLSARRAVPDGSAAVIVPLGCGFGVSLLAVLPALFSHVLHIPDLFWTEQILQVQADLNDKRTSRRMESTHLLS